MILYLSGNFPQLSDPKKERAMADFIGENGLEYRRLITFYYKKDCLTVLKIKEDLDESKEG